MKKIILGLFLLFHSAPLAAATADAYYQAGNQLYAQKNYTQAAPYYQAALQMDPGLYGAWVGLGNCSYAQGNRAQALGYYQKALALHPEIPGLNQLVQSLQTKAPSRLSEAEPAASETPASRAMALFQQRQYAMAVSYFRQALLKSPNDPTLNFYLGYCLQVTGYPRDAALAYALSNQVYPNSQVKGYADNARAGLSLEDQQWVDLHLTPQFAAAAAERNPFRQTFGIEWGSSLQWAAMADFDNCAKSFLDIAKKYQQIDPSEQFTARVPAGGVNLELNPFYRFSPDFELGATLDYMDMQDFTVESLSDSLGDQWGSIGFLILEGGLDARYHFLTLKKAKISFFAEANPFLYSVTLHLNENAPVFSQNTAVGDFTNIGIGGRLKAGADWEPLDDFKVSVFGGFQYADAQGFKGSSTDSNFHTSSGQLEVEQDNQGHRLITLVNDGDNTNGRFLSPLNVDLSGLLAGIDLSILF